MYMLRTTFAAGVQAVVGERAGVQHTVGWSVGRPLVLQAHNNDGSDNYLMICRNCEPVTKRSRKVRVVPAKEHPALFCSPPRSAKLITKISDKSGDKQDVRLFLSERCDGGELVNDL